MSRLRGHCPRLLRRPVRLVVPGISWTAFAHSLCLCERCYALLLQVREEVRPTASPCESASSSGRYTTTWPDAAALAHRDDSVYATRLCPLARKRSQYQRPPLVVYQGPRKTLCFSTEDRSDLASLEQAFHIWYHLSSTETSEECVGVPREVVPLSVQALTCVLAGLLSLLT
jgi:hypothetical protein